MMRDELVERMAKLLHWQMVRPHPTLTEDYAWEIANAKQPEDAEAARRDALEVIELFRELTQPETSDDA